MGETDIAKKPVPNTPLLIGLVIVLALVLYFMPYTPRNPLTGNARWPTPVIAVPECPEGTYQDPVCVDNCQAALNQCNRDAWDAYNVCYSEAWDNCISGNGCVEESTYCVTPMGGGQCDSDACYVCLRELNSGNSQCSINRREALRGCTYANNVCMYGCCYPF